jgi:hypothetical protein
MIAVVGLTSIAMGPTGSRAPCCRAIPRLARAPSTRLELREGALTESAVWQVCTLCHPPRLLHPPHHLHQVHVLCL